MAILPEDIGIDSLGTPVIPAESGKRVAMMADSALDKQATSTTNSSCNNQSSCEGKTNTGGCTNHVDCSGGTNGGGCTNWDKCYTQEQ